MMGNGLVGLAQEEKKELFSGDFPASFQSE